MCLRASIASRAERLKPFLPTPILLVLVLVLVLDFSGKFEAEEENEDEDEAATVAFDAIATQRCPRSTERRFPTRRVGNRCLATRRVGDRRSVP